ncbi:putative O-glycosylation ligase, exosortase A system-associated [Halorhodospira neutriphila]|uniref:O-glycosylation ligase, exosortase A system-associated n=1 Tax=Halorhodospira neutriphila TaxID=168379 RepID=A0ABS1E6M2_9GAMM|nr:putative O-glycosylation ligase, exosortase A system-associated [Halorhodospira neutriphila]MBK1727350.1 putative O-glycosylation ligase, exosortase A system-associated [Halorhodospira neutriphila]
MPLRDLFFGSLIFGMIPFILYAPWLGILGWYWIGLMNPHRLAWGPLETAPVAMAVALATLAGLLYARDKRLPPSTREVWLLLLLFVHWSVVTFLFAWEPEQAFTIWDSRMRILLMTFVTLVLIFSRERVTALLAVITLSIAFYGYKGGPHSLATGFSGMVLGPKDSFIGGNTDIGLALVMILPMAFVLARQVHQGRLALPVSIPWERLRRPLGLALYAGFWMTAIAIVGTHSRGAWLGLAAVAPFIFWRMRGKLTLVTLALLGVGVVGVTLPEPIVHEWESLVEYQQDDSAQGRFNAWNVSWNIALENPLTGSGFGTQGLPTPLWLSYYTGDDPHVQRRAVHSIYFQMLGNHGFLGLGLFLLLIASTLLTLNRLRRQAAQREETYWISEWSWALGVGIIGYCIAGAFLSLAYFDLFYAMTALAVIMRRELDDVLAREQHPAVALGPAGQPVRRHPSLQLR